MKLHNTVYFSVNLTMFFDFVTWPLFTEMCDALKKWPSDKVKEHRETNSTLCYAASLTSY